MKCKERNLKRTHGVPMMEDEWKYYKNMNGKRNAVCASVDKKWHKEQEKKEQARQAYITSQNSTPSVELPESDDEASNIDGQPDSDFEHSDELLPSPEKPPAKKPKFTYIPSTSAGDSAVKTPLTRTRSGSKTSKTKLICANDIDGPTNHELPEQYRHIRTGLRNVRDCVYEAMAEQFGNNLKLYLGKRSERLKVSLDDFRLAVDKCLNK